MVIGSIWWVGIVEDVMVYPAIHCPDTQAHQNVIVIAVVGGCRWHQLVRSYVCLVQIPIVPRKDSKKNWTHDCDQNTLFMVEVCEITLFTVDDQYTSFHRTSNSSHWPFPYHIHLHWLPACEWCIVASFLHLLTLFCLHQLTNRRKPRENDLPSWTRTTAILPIISSPSTSCLWMVHRDKFTVSTNTFLPPQVDESS